MENTSKKSILLVEDEAILAMTQKMNLEKYGYTVTIVNAGEKAVEALMDSCCFDLILMDIDLGKGIDGTQAAQQILIKHDIPIIFLSSHTEPEIVEKTEKITSYGYVVKSSSMTVLDASIKMAFKLFDAQIKLIQSEGRIQSKLNALLDPKGDIGSLELSDIIDSHSIQSLLEDFYELTGILGAILDVKGKVLVAAGWQDICTKFHRCNPKTAENCLESDIALTQGVPAATFKVYQCKNNMRDMVTPLIIDNKHIGNIFLGQFFYDDEIIDEEFFRGQAVKYGFDEKEYLEALRKVPRFSKEKVHTGMKFYSKLAEIISTLSYSSIKIARTVSEQEKSELTLQAKNEEYESQNIKLLSSVAELKKTTDALRVTNKKLHEYEEDIIETQRISKVGSWRLDITTNEVVWSEELYKIYGFDPKRPPPPYTEHQRLFTPKSWNLLSEALQNTAATGTPYELELETVLNSGKQGWMWVYGKSVFDENNKTVGLAGAAQDITERKLAEIALQTKNEEYEILNEQLRISVEELQSTSEELQATTEELNAQNEELRLSTATLRESEQKYRLLYSSMDQGLAFHEIITDTEGKPIDYIYLDINESYTRLFGVTREMAIGKRIKEVMPKVEQYWIDIFGKVALTGESSYYENYLETTGKCYSTYTYSPEKNYFAVLVTDISERKNHELLITKTINYYKTLLEKATDGIVLLDADGNFKFISNPAKIMFGYTLTEEISGNPASHTHPDDLEMVLSNLMKLLSDPTFIPTLQYRFKTKSGEWKWVESIFTNLLSDKSIESIVLNFRDITEQKLANFKIQSLLSEKELLLKEVHHRIKNNMNSIYGLLILQAGTLQDSTAIRALEEAGNRIQCMHLLYDKLYRSSGFTELSVKDYFSPLIDEIVSNFPINIKTTIEKNIQEFIIDSKKLQPLGIIINELLTNIMKYAFIGRTEGVISVSVTLKENIVSLQIADNGNGMPESVNFENSNGFGLVLVHGLTQQLGGTIRIERGQGTKIVLEFER